jgi:tetratricopeptide (TPR) repeat protein
MANVEQVDLKNEIETIKKEIEQLKFNNSEIIGKQIDKNMFSIRNLREFLTILAIIQTIFIAFAGALGFFGVKNIFDIYKYVEEAKQIKKSMESIKIEAENSFNSFKKEHEDNIVMLKTYKGSIDKLKEEQQKLTTSFNNIENINIPELVGKIENQKQKVNNVENNLNVTAQKINQKLNDISIIYNATANDFSAPLTARERLFLFTLAQKVNPDSNSPALNYNAAKMYYSMGYFEKALEYLDRIININDVPIEIRNDIKKTREDLKKEMKRPKEERERLMPPLSAKEAGIRFGSLSPVAWMQNMLTLLWRKGYITSDDGERVFKEAMVKDK